MSRKWELIYLSDTRSSVSSDIQTPGSSMSITRRSVSSDIQTPRSNMSISRRSVSFDIQTPRSNMSISRRSVLSDIQTLRSNMSITRKSVSSDIQTPRSNVSITRSSVSSYTQYIPRSDISNTRIGHFRVPPGLCFKTWVGAQPLIWKSFFILMQRKLIFTRKVVHFASFWKWGFLELGRGLLVCHLAPGVQKTDSSIHRINHYTVDKY